MTRRLGHGVVLLLLGGWLGSHTAAAQSEPNWQLIRSEDAGLEVEVPFEASYEMTRRWTIAGRLERHHYQVLHPRAGFDVERIEMPGIAVYLLSADSLLDRVRDDLMQDLEGVLDEEERLEILGQPARRLHFRRPDAHPHLEESLIVLVDHYLYIVTAGPYEPSDRSELVDRFFASFRFCIDEVAPCEWLPVSAEM
jgi:hypothetical protein